MRGVHYNHPASLVVRIGSSPHARGPLSSMEGNHFITRIIPACAGSTPIHTSRPLVVRDHPRMRGVHWTKCQKNTAKRGSSPHARGPPKSPMGMFPLERIIPACAGSTRPASQSDDSRWDHPRMRGVHPARYPGGFRSTGSSPHARGPLHFVRDFIVIFRIIPACAGSTSFGCVQPIRPRDHPRMRGVHMHSR